MRKYLFQLIVLCFVSLKAYNQTCTPLTYNSAIHSISVFPDTMDLNIKTDFCAVGNGSNDDMPAFEAAAAFINSRKGFCKLIIPNGTYKVGRQIPGYSTYYMFGVDVLRLLNVSNVEIAGENNTLIQYKSGFKYGSFNPTTGERYDPPSNISNFQDHNYAAQIGICINIFNSRNIFVHNLNLDGNFYTNNVTIGGRWGDAGIQLKHIGLNIENSGDIYASNINIQRFGLDGLYINNHQDSLNQKRIYIDYLKSSYSGRQGCSITGGELIYVNYSEFNNTGRGIIASAPSAGLNIEPNSGRFVRNIQINYCKLLNNLKNGIEFTNGTLSNNNIFNNCIVDAMDGLFAVAIGFHKKTQFNNCQFYGVSLDQGNNAINNDEGSSFKNCLFSDCYYKYNESSNQYEKATLLQINRPLFYGLNLSCLNIENCIFNAYNAAGGLRFNTSANGGRTTIKKSILNNYSSNVNSLLTISKIDFFETTIRNFLCRYDDISNCSFSNVIFQKWNNIANPNPSCEN